jgi:hypothetical protein
MKAILDSESVWIQAEFKIPDAVLPQAGPNLLQFLEEHDGHELVSIDERSATRATIVGGR